MQCVQLHDAVLQTCVVRAWDMERPLLFAPAMNKNMWVHPLTAAHISTLRSFGYEEIPVVDRVQVCGDKGRYKITISIIL